MTQDRTGEHTTPKKRPPEMDVPPSQKEKYAEAKRQRQTFNVDADLPNASKNGNKLSR